MVSLLSIFTNDSDCDITRTTLIKQEDAATAEIARVQLWQWFKYAQKTVSPSPPYKIQP
jgi:hypothetical protein